MSDKKIAVITGGATGIGKETARLLVADGVHVVVSGRREDVGKQAVVELTRDGGSASFVVADMDSPESITALFDSVLSEHGRLDYAVNNAGLAHETSAIADADPVKFQQMLSTNVMGLFLFCSARSRRCSPAGAGAPSSTSPPSPASTASRSAVPTRPPSTRSSD